MPLPVVTSPPFADPPSILIPLPLPLPLSFDEDVMLIPLSPPEIEMPEPEAGVSGAGVVGAAGFGAAGVGVGRWIGASDLELTSEF